MPREVEGVRRAIRTAAIRLPEVFAPGTRLIVGFSGGQDSTCLLHALARAHRKLELLAVHVDHGLRADSAAGAQQVADSARAIGVECRVVRVDVAAYKRTFKGASLQQAARAVRYQALANAADEYGASAILVAHTADDQAETLLLNLLRGSALLGLAGMQLDGRIDLAHLGPLGDDPKPTGTGPRLVRPLLRVSRTTTLAYCTHFGLSIVEDASNQTRVYARNRVRLDLVPALERFNPALREVLARTAELAADDVAVLDALAAELHTALQVDRQEPPQPHGTRLADERDARQPRRGRGGAPMDTGRAGGSARCEYDLAAFRAQPRALQRRVLRLALQDNGASLVDLADTPIEDALDLLQTGQPSQTYHLPNGIEVCINNKETFMLQRHHRALGRQSGNNWDVVGPRV